VSDEQSAATEEVSASTEQMSTQVKQTAVHAQALALARPTNSTNPSLGGPRSTRRPVDFR
jgi:hypothetical protein